MFERFAEAGTAAAQALPGEQANVARRMTGSAASALFTRQYGNGPDPYFCLHARQRDRHGFEELASHMPASVRLCAAHLPACFVSSTQEAWSLDRVSDEIAAAFGSVAPHSLTFVGEGIGALVGLRAALKRPELFRRFILLDAFAAVPWYFRFTADEGYRSLLAQMPPLGEFARLDLPVDIIFGSRTSRAVRASAKVWQDLWHRSRTWEVPGAGHNLLEEVPEIVSTLMFESRPAPAAAIRRTRLGVSQFSGR